MKKHCMPRAGVVFICSHVITPKLQRHENGVDRAFILGSEVGDTVESVRQG